MKKRICTLLLATVLFLCSSCFIQVFAATVSVPAGETITVMAKNAVLSGSSDAVMSGSYAALDTKSTAAFTISVEESGLYRLFIEGITWNVATGARITVNTFAAGSVDMGNTSNKQETVTAEAGVFYLYSGVNQINVKPTGGVIYLHSIILEPTESGEAELLTVLADNGSVTKITGSDKVASDGLKATQAIFFTLDVPAAGDYMLSLSTIAVDGCTVDVLKDGEAETITWGNWYYDDTPVTVSSAFAETEIGRLSLVSGTNCVTVIFNHDMSFAGIRLEKIFEPAAEDVKQFLTKINQAEYATEVQAAMAEQTTWKFSAEPEDLFYPQAVYGGLIGQNFASFTEFNEALQARFTEAKSNPLISLTCGNYKTEKLKIGTHTVSVAPVKKSGLMAAVATYKGGQLQQVDVQKTSTTQSMQLSAGNVTDAETTCKVILLDGLSTLCPVESYEAFSEQAREIFVSQRGSDTGDGTKENPFRTIEKAKAYIRTFAFAMDRDVVVNILPGDYYLEEPLTFTAADSGMNGYKIIYNGAYGEERSVINGGVPVKDWQPVGGGIYKAHAAGVTEARQFYIGGVPAERAKSEGLYIAADRYTGCLGTSQTIEFETYSVSSGWVKPDEVAGGKAVYVSSWTSGKNPSLSIPFTVSQAGYYDTSCIMGYSAYADSHSRIFLSVDGKSIGDNSGPGVALEGYQPHGVAGMPMHQYQGKRIWLDAGSHTLTAKISNVAGASHYTFLMDSISFIPAEVEQGFYLSGYDLPAFAHPEELELASHIYWTMQRLPVKDVIAQEDDRHLFLMDQPYYYSYTSMVCEGGVQPVIGCRFYIENALELLDKPGEFYFDKTNQDLYYYPHDISELSQEAYLPKSEGLLQMKGMSTENKVHDVEFRNLDFKYGAYNSLSETGHCSFQADCLMPYAAPNTQPSSNGLSTYGQVEMTNVDSVSITNCNFSNLGSSAISMLEGVSNVAIEQNAISDISATAVMVGSWRYSASSNTATLCDGITLQNNYIARIGQELMGSPAIGIYYARNVDVLHNHIKDTPYTGITIGWGWGSSIPKSLLCGGHNIVGNRIERNSREEADGGAIYMLGYLHNTRIAENYINDSPDFAAIYMDSGTSDVLIERNVMQNFSNWTRGNPKNGTLRKNFVDQDKHAVTISADKNSTLTGTTVIAGGAWVGQSAVIADNSGLKHGLRGLITSPERPETWGTVYDYVPRTESVSSDDVLIEGEDHLPGSGEGYFVGASRTPNIYTQGNGRKVVAAFGPNMWFKYSFTAPKAGKYRVELRYSTGPNSSPDTTGATVTVNAAKKLSDTYLSMVAMPGTQTPWTAYPSKTVGYLYLPAGENTLQLTNRGNEWTFDNIKLIYEGAE